MDPSRWQKIEELFHQASELPPDDIDGFLETATEDAGLRVEVRSLLDSADDDETVVQQAVQRAAEQAIQVVVGDAEATDRQTPTGRADRPLPPA